MGYLGDIIGIEARHERLRSAWGEHLRRTREFILASAEACEVRRHVVVLGSGWLLDVPWMELGGLFDKVSLVDVIHPQAVRHRVRSFSNIRCVTMDLMGVTDGLFGMGAGDALPVLKAVDLSELGEVDFCVSSNILSQLPILPGEFLEKKWKVTPSVKREFSRNIQQSHLDLLQKLSCPTCLVTDVESLKFDGQNRLLEREDLLNGLVLPQGQQEWIWPLAPLGEISKQYRMDHRVVGVKLHPK